LLTHGHFDHVFYAGEIAEFYGAKNAIHPADITLIGESLGIAEMYYNMNDYTALYPDQLLADGDVITMGEISIRVIHTPGHSMGGVCFQIGDVVFTGDTIFAGSIGRSDFPGGSMDELTASIQNKLYVLDDSVVLYPGHGDETTVGEEKRTNPYVQGKI
jgi:glyoxylase-like metal-dependent hydrolase (beta-lactamase superfamily II)